MSTEKDLTELFFPSDVVEGFAIADPDGKVTDDDGRTPWGIGETEEAAWHNFGYPALNIQAYKAEGWHTVATKLRRKSK